MSNPTIQRRRLGNALRRAREQAGRTQDEAAERIDAAASKISRLELGQSGIKLTDLAVLLDFYRVDGDQAESMYDLARAGRQRGRWSGYRNVVPDWFRQYVDLEADACEIRWYQPEVIPGILQTEAYVRAMTATAHPCPTVQEQERHVRVRLERQTILTRAGAPDLAFVISESALRRNVGGAGTMRAQLAHLAEIGERPNIELQILPFDAQTYETSSFAFVVLRFDADATSDVIYLEDYTDATYLDRYDAVRAYTRLYSRLQAAASGPVESRALILRTASDLQQRLIDSEPTMSTAEPLSAAWRKSSRSDNNGGSCVEVAALPHAVAVRDSKNPDGGTLMVDRPGWISFIDGIKNGDFTRR
jgi:transcriptional regulator with XRE-family HTH domain